MGINNGILDRKIYESCSKGWKAVGCVTEGGLLGYVQPVGVAPGEAFADETEVYGIGAFLAAGSKFINWLVGKR